VGSIARRDVVAGRSPWPSTRSRSDRVAEHEAAVSLVDRRDPLQGGRGIQWNKGRQ